MIGQKSKAWLAEYNRTIGGSIAPVVTGLSRYATPREEAEYRLGLRERPDISGLPDPLRGTMLEPVAIEVARHQDIPVTPHPQTLFRYHEALPWAHALPDGWIQDVLAEIKSPRPETWHRWKMHGLPAEHLCQVQHNMAVCGARKAKLIALHCVTMQLLVAEIEYDADTVAGIMEREREFSEMIARGELPPETPREPVKMPDSVGSMVTLDAPEAIAAAEAYAEASAVMKEAEALVDDCKAQLVKVAGPAAMFEVPLPTEQAVLRIYHQEQAGRVTFDSKAAIAADPSLARFQKQGQPFKTFRHYIVQPERK